MLLEGREIREDLLLPGCRHSYDSRCGKLLTSLKRVCVFGISAKPTLPGFCRETQNSRLNQELACSFKVGCLLGLSSAVGSFPHCLFLMYFLEGSVSLPPSSVWS